jgi:hypothetical protein
MSNRRPDGSDGSERSETAAEIGCPAETAPTLPLPVATSLVATQTAELIEVENAIDPHLMRRIENLPREAGWALITAGVIGVIAPGILGWPFVVAGAFVLAPGGTQRLARWAGRKPRKHAHAALRQICRLVDDLERRYPSVRADAPPVVVRHCSYIDVQ